MENLEILDFDTTETGLHITPQSREFLRETAKWAKFIAIMGFIFIGLMVMGGVGVAISGAAFAGVGSPGFGIGISLMYIVFAGIYFFPVLYLFQFATKTKQALLTNSTPLLTESLEFLKSHYKFMGIMMIVILSLYAMIFIVGMVFVGTRF